MRNGTVPVRGARARSILALLGGAWVLVLAGLVAVAVTAPEMLGTPWPFPVSAALIGLGAVIELVLTARTAGAVRGDGLDLDRLAAVVRATGLHVVLPVFAAPGLVATQLVEPAWPAAALLALLHVTLLLGIARVLGIQRLLPRPDQPWRPIDPRVARRLRRGPVLVVPAVLFVGLPALGVTLAGPALLPAVAGLFGLVAGMTGCAVLLRRSVAVPGALHIPDVDRATTAAAVATLCGLVAAVAVTGPALLAPGFGAGVAGAALWFGLFGLTFQAITLPAVSLGIGR